MFLSFRFLAGVLVTLKDCFAEMPNNKSNSFETTIDNQATFTDIPPIRRLFVAITSTSDLQAAVSAWCSDSAGATSTYGDISGWDIAGVTSLSNMFNGYYDPYVVSTSYCGSSSQSFNANIATWDTSSVTSMFCTFNFAFAFNRAIGNLDTSMVTNLYSTFNSAKSFDQPIGNWDTSSVTTLFSTFRDAHAFNQELNDWDTSKVTTLSSIFRNTVAFNKDISSFDTALITSLDYAFNIAAAFDQDISSWDTSSVTSILSAFNNAYSFNEPIGSWDASAMTDLSYAFYEAQAFYQVLCWDIPFGAEISNFIAPYYGLGFFECNSSYYQESSYQALCMACESVSFQFYLSI